MEIEHTSETDMNSEALTVVADSTSATILWHTTETSTLATTSSQTLAVSRSQGEQSLDVNRIVLQGIQGFIILLANICVFIAIRKSKSLRISTRILMSNLAVADCMQGLAMMVATVTDILKVSYTGYGCVGRMLLNIVPAGVSEIGIILMAWECFWTIKNLRITKTGLGKKPAVILAILSWTFYIVFVLFAFTAIKLKVPGCSLSVSHFEKGYIVVYAVILGLNTTLLCAFFVGALLALRKHRQQIAPSVPIVHVTKPALSQPASLQPSASSLHPPQQSASLTTTSGSQNIKSRWLEIQSTLVTIIGLMVAVYIVVRLPFQIYIFSYYLCGRNCKLPPGNILRILGQILRLKSLANAVIYTCKSREFRSGLKQAFRCVIPHGVVTEASTVFEVPSTMPVSQNVNNGNGNAN